MAGRNGRGSGGKAFDKPSHVTLAGNLDYVVNDRNKRGQRRDFDMKVLDFLGKGSAQWTLAGAAGQVLSEIRRLGPGPLGPAACR